MAISEIFPQYMYAAQIIRWVDGDTVDLTVDVGFHITVNARFRLWGIDTPERGHEKYAEARAFAERLAPAGASVNIATLKSADKYGRYLVRILTDEGLYVAEELVKAGFAVNYYGGTK